MLERLERANLFLLSLDQKREWYRYHQLFVDLLRYRLERERPGFVPELHRRASWWFTEASDPDSAMKHALAAGDLDLAAQVAEQFALLMTGSGRLIAYLASLQRLPDELIFARAYLCLGCAWAYVLTFQLQPCLHPGAVATGVVERDPDLSPLARLMYNLFKPFFMTPEKGAITPVYLASSPEVEQVTGKYFINRVPVQSSPESYDREIAIKLWQASTQLTRLAAPLQPQAV